MKNKLNSVEVVDIKNYPFARMNLTEVHRQSLRHRSVIVLVYDSNGKLYLQKRNAEKRYYPGRWDLSASGHVYFKESFEDAALRVLKTKLGIEYANIKELTELNASSETGYEFIKLFVLDKPNIVPAPNPDEVESGFFYSMNELEWLLKECRELLAPKLVYLNEIKMLYKMK
ncbi:NUDIX domain-containing protein [Desulfovibrio sp. UCD-KL4C]|uniref:NUDIX hydrolase n=1 Tax=Desulfovibrio sp. UCD-KL4C TaxID=2578120 RepID=UPI0025BF4978|nr:NUDIX domain-containing protein [Desulfovibrio sp. UCD-KL4C]